jgi:hypothetical protein
MVYLFLCLTWAVVFTIQEFSKITKKEKEAIVKKSNKQNYFSNFTFYGNIHFEELSKKITIWILNILQKIFSIQKSNIQKIKKFISLSPEKKMNQNNNFNQLITNLKESKKRKGDDYIIKNSKGFFEIKIN